MLKEDSTELLYHERVKQCLSDTFVNLNVSRVGGNLKDYNSSCGS